MKNILKEMLKCSSYIILAGVGVCLTADCVKKYVELWNWIKRRTEMLSLGIVLGMLGLTLVLLAKVKK